jgi:ribonuclease HII
MQRFFSDSFILEAGCDEAGRGPLAGPVLAAAVILPENFEIKGLNDSKKLDEKVRLGLEDEIKKQALAWALGECSAAEIDSFNILNASILAMHRALDKLVIRPELILVDGNRFKNYPFTPHFCMVKGDARFASIAAASILAKNERDRIMKKLALEYPGYGWEHNMAYPTIEHRKALEKLGPTSQHRKSFKPKSVI